MEAGVPLLTKTLPWSLTFHQPAAHSCSGWRLRLPSRPPVTELEIKSPMIGTFYRAPSPESAPYVEVGTEVNPDTVVCIIEAMKVMNEIKAEAKGVITAGSGRECQAGEFGQPLFKLRPT